VKEASLPDRPGLSVEVASFLACVATVIEIPVSELPEPSPDDDPVSVVGRWLGGLRLGLISVADPASFAWAGPWIARLNAAQGQRCVVMFGVPSGVVWDPAGRGHPVSQEMVEHGFVIAASDIAEAMPSRHPSPLGVGTIETIATAALAGAPVTMLTAAYLHAGRGVAGDRHLLGTGTFPSGIPGSSLTLIEAEVCESFDPPLSPDEHRRNVVTRGIDLNRLVGREFNLGRVRCRGMRLCEPCAVMQRYAGRPVLRALVHRAGLRADIIDDGEIKLADPVIPAPSG